MLISKRKENKSLEGRVMSGWKINVYYGINEFRGDIRTKKLLQSSNMGSIYNFRIGKSINEMFIIYSTLGIGNLKGMLEKDDYLISQTQSTLVYDPYSNYEGKGEQFEAVLYEGELTVSFNLEKLIKKIHPNYMEKKRLDLSYNLGLGVLSFSSMKRNIESNNYIYAFGHNDTESKFEEELPFFKKPKARYLSFGYSLSYLVTERINISFLWIGKLADTDFLDASMMNQQNDRYRSILLGLEYNL
jgi:hypothetical protein